MKNAKSGRALSDKGGPTGNKTGLPTGPTPGGKPQGRTSGVGVPTGPMSGGGKKTGGAGSASKCVIAILMLGMAYLVACTPTNPNATPTPVPTVIVADTPVPTAAPTVAPEPTAIPTPGLCKAAYPFGGGNCGPGPAYACFTPAGAEAPCPSDCVALAALPDCAVTMKRTSHPKFMGQKVKKKKLN